MDSKDLNEEIVARIILQRNLKGLTQKQIAELTDYSTKNISKIEKGQTNISISHLEKFSKIFDQDIMYFLPSEYTNNAQNKMDKFQRKVASLDKVFQEEVFKIIEDFEKMQDTLLDRIKKEIK